MKTKRSGKINGGVIRWLLLINVFLTFIVTTSYGQKIAVKTNLLYDATTTLNLGVEVGLGKRWTADISGNFNRWFFGYYRFMLWLVLRVMGFWFCVSL